MYEKIEQGKLETFNLCNGNGHIYYQFIKRPIDISIDHNMYYDIVTPYGYGGPLIIWCEIGRKKNLIQDFNYEFQKYCRENRIVSEFVRFHPLTGNQDDFTKCYNISFDRYTVGTNLAEFTDPFQSEFSKSCRKNIRKALNNEVSYRITEKPKDVSEFKKIYYATMNRNEASEFYYFDDEYFDQCVDSFRDNLLLVEALYNQQTIAMGLYFIYDKTIHIHLSGTLNEFLYLSPAYILRYATTMWGEKNGYELIHHGGGRTTSLDDSLYLFKKQFGKNTEFEFFTGKKVWNEEVYERLCNIAGIESSSDFFPAYRKRS